MANFPFQYFNDVSLSVVVPVYNEGAQIQENLRLLLDEVKRYFQNVEVIVISDGSTDTTNEQLKLIADENLKKIFLENNQGKGAALRKGFKEASGDFVLFIDGGMELHPREIKIFLGLMFLYESDIVIGSKRHPQSTVYYPWYRRFLSFLFQKIVHSLFRINVTDTQVGIKMFRRDVINAIMPYLESQSYGVDIEILGFAARLGYRRILEAPVRLDYFLMNKRSFIQDGLHTLRVGSLLFKETLWIWWRLRKIKQRSS